MVLQLYFVNRCDWSHQLEEDKVKNKETYFIEMLQYIITSSKLLHGRVVPFVEKPMMLMVQIEAMI